ncbi:MAG: hypothetical protein BWY77_01910 [bacterium ADurb.Bin431]|nr:MAG: hypothetical protein BWY77_01910 [bacterium ADurb.Bin431]
MVLARAVVGQPGDNHFGTGETDQAYNPFEVFAVTPVSEGVHEILAGSILAIQKPEQVDAEGRSRAAHLDFANGAHG